MTTHTLQPSGSIIDREHQQFLQTYKRLPIVVEHAEGMEVFAADGTRYLDFLGGIAVNALGHSNPKVIEAITRQLGRYTHLSNYFYQDAQIEFVERLCSASGYGRIFLGNSGAEANEGAIKLARAHGAKNGKMGVIGFSGGFHGRTYGVLSVMDKPAYKDGMGPFLPDTSVLPFNDVDALQTTVNNTTCALIIEFLQGEGGIRWATPEFIAAIAALRDKHGFLVIADEVQAGVGRTGDFFSFERFGFRPDIVTLAKGVGGGLPLSAILVNETLAGVWHSGQHGTTFGGNALACVAGSVVLDELANGLMTHVAEVGDVLQTELARIAEKHPQLVAETRGSGAIAGMELTLPGAAVVEEMLRRGIIINVTNERVLRFLPPLIVTAEQVREMSQLLDDVLGEYPGTVS